MHVSLILFGWVAGSVLAALTLLLGGALFQIVVSAIFLLGGMLALVGALLPAPKAFAPQRAIKD